MATMAISKNRELFLSRKDLRAVDVVFLDDLLNV